MNCKGTRIIQSFVLAAFLMVLNSIVAPAARAGTPCCNITGINLASGIVTAKVNATGQQFEFKLSNSAQLRTLKAGQAIYANLRARQVSLDGLHPAGQIISVGPEPAKPMPVGAGGPTSNPKLAFTPYGLISSVQGLSAVATKQQGTAAQPQSLQFQIPPNQQGQTRPGQPVWASANGQQVRFVAFPIQIPDTKTRVGRGPGKGSFWVETRDAMVSSNGNISGVTKVQSEDVIAGFTGNVALRLLDSQGNDLSGWLKAGCWGVNMRSGRTETWTIHSDPGVALNTRTVELRQFDSPCGHDRWAAALAKAKDVAQVLGQFAQVYTSLSGSGGTGPSTTTPTSTPN